MSFNNDSVVETIELEWLSPQVIWGGVVPCPDVAAQGFWLLIHLCSVGSLPPPPSPPPPPPPPPPAPPPPHPSPPPRDGNHVESGLLYFLKPGF
jgi:hypothetical protein